MIFQDPYESLNPRFTVSASVGEPLDIQGIEAKEKELRVKELLKKVGLTPPKEFLLRYPHELSGGQRQRVALARALVTKPEFVVADEPCSMLDVSIRANMLNMLRELRAKEGLTFLYITHDLAEARYLTDRLVIIYLGKIVEEGPTQALVEEPLHPYTKALISAVPIANPDIKRKRIRMGGELPKPIDLPRGCRFSSLCPKALAICKEEEPTLKRFGGDRKVACHLL